MFLFLNLVWWFLKGLFYSAVSLFSLYTFIWFITDPYQKFNAPLMHALKSDSSTGRFWILAMVFLALSIFFIGRANLDNLHDMMIHWHKKDQKRKEGKGAGNAR